MKNVKFFLKLILALIPVVAIVLYTALFPYGYGDDDFAAWQYKKDVISGKCLPFASNENDGPSSVIGTKPANTVILGDSRAMAALNPLLFPKDTVNLAVGGATSIEMYYTLSHYIENNGEPDNIVIMFAPFHYSIIDNFWTRSVYFDFFSVNDLLEIYNIAGATNSETLLCQGYTDDILSFKLHMPNKYLPALMNSHLVGRYSANKESYNNLFNNQGHGEFGHANGSDELTYETSYSEMHSTNDAVLLDIYTNKLLAFCEEKGINTTLAMPPFNEASFNALRPSYSEDFSEYIRVLENKHPGIDVHGDFYYLDNQYFGDASHLNYEGAKVFTNSFLSDIYLK